MRPRSTSFPAILLGTLLLLATGQPLRAAETHPSLPRPGVVDGLGTNIHFTDPQVGEMAMLADGGFRWVRMDLTWGSTERERGEYDFSAYDRLVEALESHKIRALFILDYSNRLYEQDRSVRTADGRQAYARWAAAAVDHFQGRGILWEIWNEPNIKGFWRPEPNADDYTAMALAAAKAMRQVAPQEAIIGPATSTIDLEFLEQCFQAGLLDWWDAVSVHPYRQSPPETVTAEYYQLRRLIAKYAPQDKTIPILSAEWGYSSVWKGFDAAKQGRMLARQWLTNLSQQIPISIWYDWHDDGRDPQEPEHHFGTVAYPHHADRDPVYEPKPAYLAAKTLTSRLDGHPFDKRIATGQPDDYVLLFRNGPHVVLAVWTTEQPHPIRVPSSRCEFDVVSHVGEIGKPLTAADGHLLVAASRSPQYLLAKGPNPALIQAAMAYPARTQILPGPGDCLSVRINPLAETTLRGKLQLVDVKGLDLVKHQQPINILAGEPSQTISFGLRASPARKFQLGLRIEDEAGNRLHTRSTQRFVLLGDDLLQSARIVADGDANVNAELSSQVGQAPEPWGDSDAQVLHIRYQFESGWKFLRLVPPTRTRTGVAPQITGEPTGFGMWIYGDGQQAIPRLRVVDSTGQTWQPSGSKIDWKGWRYVKFPLTTSSGHWGGADDSQIHFPLKWDSVFLLDNASRRECKGNIFITAPVAIY